jgi:prepilin-type N-terminal cleavage/methylation domain-containing protein
MPQRSGLTLTEVLVALVILAIMGAMLLPRVVTRQELRRAEHADAMKAVIDTTRALAVQRQQALRLRVYPDGLWSVEATSDRDPIAAGTVSAPPAGIDLTIDARGACRATPGWVPREVLRAVFDAGKCAFEPAP